MVHINNSFIILVILLNILNLLGFIFCKLNYQNESKVLLVSKVSLFLSIFLILYTLCLFILSEKLFLAGYKLIGAITFLLSIIPFIIGKIASYQKADFFINLQIAALMFNFVFIVFYC